MPEPNENTDEITKDLGQTLVYYGSTVKTLGDGRIGGILVLFSTGDDPDLDGQYFTKDTDFGPAQTTLVWYHHAQDRKVRHVLDERASLKKDDVGIWVEAQLKMRDAYERYLYSMAEKGKLGWSSGTAEHLIEVERTGSAEHIKRWYLGLDASLTPTPCEPRNQAIPIKSLGGSFPQLPDLDATGEAQELGDGSRSEVDEMVAGYRKTQRKALQKLAIMLGETT